MSDSGDKFPLPKYYQIAEDIKRRIKAGEFREGGRLPGNRDLTAHYDTSTATVTNVLRLLDQQGVIEKVQGRGIFVKTAAKKTERKKRLKIGFLMSNDMDVYSSFYTELQNRLDSAGCSIILLNYALLNANPTSQTEKIKVVERIAEDSYDHLVIRGGWHFAFKALYKLRHRLPPIHWVFEKDCALSFAPENTILPDWEEVGRLAARYLIQDQRRRLVLCKVPTPAHYMKNNGCDLLKSGLLEKGFREEMILSGLNTDTNFLPLILSESPNATGISCDPLFQTIEDGWDGFLLPFDAVALQVYREYRESGLVTERKIGLLGTYNTSWSEFFYPPLATIDINTKILAEHTANCILNNLSGQRIHIAPKLIDRKT